MIRNLYWFSCNVPVIIVPQIFKNTQISNFMKIREVAAQLFHADGQTWRRQNVAFQILEMRLNLTKKKDHTETRFDGVNRKEVDEDEPGDKSCDLTFHVGTRDVTSH